ncbi:MAG: hypothetical protein R2824_19820 [Saprospiraceae bacterium]|nr:hypothetical protein [Lewinella sp.]
MGYTLCQLVEFDDQANWDQEFYFHPSDVQRVMSQPGADKSLIVRIRGRSTGKEGFGLIGCTVDPAGEIEFRLNGDSQFLALSCKPWNETGDTFDEAP